MGGLKNPPTTKKGQEGDTKNMITGKILVTGGAGTIGNAIIERAKRDSWDCDFTIYSRSESRQAEMRRAHPRLNYVIGDVRDSERLTAVTAGHDVIIHAAAMKRIPECETNPIECIKTNVMGSWNVVRAAVKNNVKRVIGLSTDKACQSVTHYGASKLMMERIFQAQPVNHTIFTLVRYGNVIESTGSVIPLWREQAAKNGRITLTDKRMTRFWITPDDAVDWIISAYDLLPSTVYIPKMKALSLVDMAGIVAPGAEIQEIGLRSMERLHEYLVSPDETATEHDDHYLINEMGTMGHVYRSNTAVQYTSHEFRLLLAKVGLNA